MNSARNIVADLLLLQMKLNTMKTYNLTEQQYTLLEEFFTRNKTSNDLISSEIVEKFLIKNIHIRKGEISASELDVTRIIGLLSSTPGYLTFGELLDLLNLALASKSKITIRILQFLNNKDRFSTVNPEDGSKYCDFLSAFYSPGTAKLVRAHKQVHTRNTVFELVNKLRLGDESHLESKLICPLTSSVDKRKFAEEIAPYFKDSVFV